MDLIPIKLPVFTRMSASPLVDENFIFYKASFANIKSTTNAEKEIANTLQNIEKLKFKIKFDEEIAMLNSNNNFKVKFEDRFYKIKQVIDVDKMHNILEIEGEFDGIRD